MLNSKILWHVLILGIIGVLAVLLINCHFDRKSTEDNLKERVLVLDKRCDELYERSHILQSTMSLWCSGDLGRDVGVDELILMLYKYLDLSLELKPETTFLEQMLIRKGHPYHIKK